jgi:hypothetical protein
MVYQLRFVNGLPGAYAQRFDLYLKRRSFPGLTATGQHAVIHNPEVCSIGGV